MSERLGAVGYGLVQKIQMGTGNLVLMVNLFWYIDFLMNYTRERYLFQIREVTMEPVCCILAICQVV